MKINGVSQSVTQKVRMEIVLGRIPERTRLNEVEFAKKLGISRPPLREAFRRLENEGLIISIPRKGCFVTETSEEGWEHLHKARKIIECTSVEAVSQQQVRDFSLMKKVHAKTTEIERPDMKDGMAKSETVFAWVEALSNFHLCLVETTRNNWLMHCYRQLCPSLSRYQAIYLNQPDFMSSSIDEHGVFLRMLEAGKYSDALDYLVVHIDGVSEQLKHNMRVA